MEKNGKNFFGTKPRIASETFGTAIMKTDEVVLYVQAATENGSTLEQAYDDMQMVDRMLHMKILHTAVHGQVKTTKSGYLRKGTSYYDSLLAMIEQRTLKPTDH